MPVFFKDKTKLFVFSNKFRNKPERKLLDQNLIELIENVLFRSIILFQKLLYSIFFRTKATKRMLPILKERRFDIAILYIWFGKFKESNLITKDDFHLLLYYLLILWMDTRKCFEWLMLIGST